MALKVVGATDGNGEPYLAYEGQTKSGTIVHIDKACADESGEPEKIMAMEIIAFELAEEGKQPEEFGLRKLH